MRVFAYRVPPATHRPIRDAVEPGSEGQIAIGACEQDFFDDPTHVDGVQGGGAPDDFDDTLSGEEPVGVPVANGGDVHPIGAAASAGAAGRVHGEDGMHTGAILKKWTECRGAVEGYSPQCGAP